ncbi:unnamed protein product [marine sediment metagenome]|uniref:N-acetyltransferase domain-containing protein n=1 Tax=marine sediment metagenome TaxID=412755 RepID=X0XCQ3_9ZZZZ
MFNPTYTIPLPKEPLQIIIRTGKGEDLGTLTTLLHESLPDDFNIIEDAAKCVKKWLTEMPDYIIVAEYNKKPIGVILVSPETYPILDANLAMLCFLAVEQTVRRRGVGKALVTRVCEVLKKKGKTSMEVDTSATNIQARIFYTKTGFFPFWFSKNYMPKTHGIFYRINF